MNTFLVLAAILGTVFARPGGLLPDGSEGHVSVTQSSSGTYKYIVELKDSLRTEERLLDGTVIVENIMIDANGEQHIVKYSSGPDGFKLLGGDASLIPIGAVPVPVEDTPEVKAAKEEFFALYKAAEARSSTE